MSERLWLDLRGKRVRYRVRLDEAALYFEIESYLGDQPLGHGFVSRFDLAAVVAACQQVDAQATALAQAEEHLIRVQAGEDEYWNP